MTAEQYARYQAAMITGYTSGVGGATWTYCPPVSGNGITATSSAPASDGTITGYVVQERLAQYGQPMPPQPVGAYQWRFVGPVGTDVETGGIIVSGSYAFTFGPIDTYQGFPTAIMEATTVPTLTTTPTHGIRAGLRIGLQIGF